MYCNFNKPLISAGQLQSDVTCK